MILRVGNHSYERKHTLARDLSYMLLDCMVFLWGFNQLPKVDTPNSGGY